MQFESDLNTMSTILFQVSDQATFDSLIDLAELPEATLEVAEVRELTDEYLDTPTQALQAAGSAVRLATVGTHHFLIYQRQGGTKLLPAIREFVERLTPSEHTAQRSGDRAHPLYGAIQVDTGGELESQLVRHSTFQSKLFRVGETRFELGLEAVRYERSGRLATDRMLQLELIEGDPDVVLAIGEYLKVEYQLQPVFESPVVRGQRILNEGSGQGLVD